MKKFVWDTSAILNIKETNPEGYSPAYSLYRDLADGYIAEKYLNIFPSLAIFEIAASVSRKLREGEKILREFYLINENSVIYNINQELLFKCNNLFTERGFDRLRGADLVFACIAYVEKAYLVTLDKQFYRDVSSYVNVLDLNDSKDRPNYRRQFQG